MNREIIARARGGWCGAFGVRSNRRFSKSGFNGSASRRSRFSSQASATEPTPSVLACRTCRRFIGSGEYIACSIDVQESVAAQQRLAEHRGRPHFGRRGRGLTIFGLRLTLGRGLGRGGRRHLPERLRLVAEERHGSGRLGGGR